eukprot:12431224-Karenia_brevis.AAC.1
MFRDVTCEISKAGFRWNADSLKVLHTDSREPKNNMQVEVNGVMHVLAFTEELEVLGCKIAPWLGNAAAADHRLEKASSAFWAMSAFFLCKDVPIQKRLAEYHKRILPIATYGSSGWQY